MASRKRRSKKKAGICDVRMYIATAYVQAHTEAETGHHRAAAKRAIKHLRAALKATKGLKCDARGRRAKIVGRNVQYNLPGMF